VVVCVVNIKWKYRESEISLGLRLERRLTIRDWRLAMALGVRCQVSASGGTTIGCHCYRRSRHSSLLLVAGKTALAVGIVIGVWLAIAGAEGRGRGQSEVIPSLVLEREGNGEVSH
jgi:hypothetical protein